MKASRRPTLAQLFEIRSLKRVKFRSRGLHAVGRLGRRLSTGRRFARIGRGRLGLALFGRIHPGIVQLDCFIDQTIDLGGFFEGRGATVSNRLELGCDPDRSLANRFTVSHGKQRSGR